MPSSNTVWHEPTVTPERREALNRHRAVALWFTGLSGAGKSTVAHALEERLHQMGCRTYVFDGDNVRHGLCADLGFSREDRAENLRRISEMVKLFNQAGVIALTAFISPFAEDRHRVRDTIGAGNFIEVFCNTPLAVCEQRDVKGLYQKARNGEIPDFTGISSPYEVPEAADVVLDTGSDSIEDCVEQVIRYLVDRKLVSVPDRVVGG
ncbi:MAG: adenylyl-sulfate kinase [Gammaproteobacteria bacterium]|jgi:adenylylsulfate kinase|nr:adenylyl-sulfate kinase [Gammaproteobacteria bacterium]